VVRAIQHLKAQGYKVLFYPFLMMDIPAAGAGAVPLARTHHRSGFCGPGLLHPSGRLSRLRASLHVAERAGGRRRRLRGRLRNGGAEPHRRRRGRIPSGAVLAADRGRSRRPGSARAASSPTPPTGRNTAATIGAAATWTSRWMRFGPTRTSTWSGSTPTSRSRTSRAPSRTRRRSRPAGRAASSSNTTMPIRPTAISRAAATTHCA
jgi:hypothetical protein